MAMTKVLLLHDPRKPNPWIVRYYGDFDPTTGKQRRPGKSFRLKRYAERFRAKLQREFDKGAPRDTPEDVSLDEYCRIYVERRNHEWAPKTRQHIDVLIQRLLGHFRSSMSLRSITPEQVAVFWANSKSIREGREGGEISRSTRNRILRDARTMFRYAVIWRFIESNPFEGLRQIRVSKRTRQDWRYVKPEEYRRLLRVAPDLRWKVFYALAYTTAARFGELFSLTQEHVDLSRGRLLIRNCKASDELPPFQVKDHEDREIPLPRHVVRLLQGWLLLRPKGSPLILVTPERFRTILARWRDCQRTGKPWINNYLMNNVIRDIRRHATLVGLSNSDALTVHCFRKSCIQNWANHLPMNVVKELAGHANIATTAEFYCKVCPEHEEHAQWVGEAVFAIATPRTRENGVRKIG
jgi:integrase